MRTRLALITILRSPKWLLAVALLAFAFIPLQAHAEVALDRSEYPDTSSYLGQHTIKPDLPGRDDNVNDQNGTWAKRYPVFLQQTTVPNSLDANG